MGINGVYVYDRLRVGTDERQTHSDGTLERLESTGDHEAPLTFAEMHISESDNML